MKKLNKIKNYSLKAAKIGKKKKAKGFTLVELIVVIAIIGILAAILVPTITNKISDAKQTAAEDGLAKVREIAEIEAVDYLTDNAIASAVTADQDTSKTGTNLDNLIASALNITDTDVDWSVTVGTDGKVTAASYSKGGVTESYP